MDPFREFEENFNIVVNTNQSMKELRITHLEGRYTIENVLKVVNKIRVPLVHIHVPNLIVMNTEYHHAAPSNRTEMSNAAVKEYVIDELIFKFTKMNVINYSRNIFEYDYRGYHEVGDSQMKESLFTIRIGFSHLHLIKTEAEL